MSTDINEDIKKLFGDCLKQFDQFVRDNAALDLASLNGTLGELRHTMYEEVKEEYEDMVNPPDSEDSSEGGGENGVVEIS